MRQRGKEGLQERQHRRGIIESSIKIQHLPRKQYGVAVRAFVGVSKNSLWCIGELMAGADRDMTKEASGEKGLMAKGPC